MESKKNQRVLFYKNGQYYYNPYGENSKNEEHLCEVFFKNNHMFFRKKGCKVYWVEEGRVIGRLDFSFDMERVFNAYRDYPDNLKNKKRYWMKNARLCWKLWAEKE